MAARLRAAHRVHGAERCRDDHVAAHVEGEHAERRGGERHGRAGRVAYVHRGQPGHKQLGAIDEEDGNRAGKEAQGGFKSCSASRGLRRGILCRGCGGLVLQAGPR